MDILVFKDGVYETAPCPVSFCARHFPSLVFYRYLLPIVFRSSAKAKRSLYDSAAWCASSLEVLRALEHVGVSVEITGADHFLSLEGPCLFVANHMSTLETFVLPSIIGPFRSLTFVVKQGLLDYPVFRHVMRSRDPITVLRENPRDDLKAVLEGGVEKLKAGWSLIIFPQSTRYAVFDPKIFNSMGIKLAKRANVPLIPIALKTDAWAEGKYVKDLGRVYPSRKVHFAFGKPLWVKDRGNEEHNEVISFIISKLKEWNGEVADTAL
jgi:1-acyl-sn-glycerol-3-phosphate acyltransferase